MWSAIFGNNKQKREKQAASHRELAETVASLAAQLDEMRSQMAELEGPRTLLAEWFPETAAVNLNRRGQVLRLHRRGESPDDIASALSLSQGEVKLIIKVHQLSRNVAEPEKPGDPALNFEEMFDRGYTGLTRGGRRT